MKEAKKGFAVIFVLLCACLLILGCLLIAGWNLFGREYANTIGTVVNALPDYAIDIESEELEEYLQDHHILCTQEKSGSIGGYEVSACSPEEAIEGLEFRITYLVKANKPTFLTVGMAERKSAFQDPAVAEFLEIIVGIPYAGADPVEAKKWLRSCLAIENYDDLMITKYIADVALSIRADPREGFTLSLSKRMEVGFDEYSSLIAETSS